MLWFMGFTSHFSFQFDSLPGAGKLWVSWIIFLVTLAFIEASALGVVGGYDSQQNKLMFDRHRNTIIAGFALWAVLFFIGFEAVIGGA